MIALLVKALAPEKLHKRLLAPAEKPFRQVIAKFSKCGSQVNQTYLLLNNQVYIIKFARPHLKSNASVRLNTPGSEALPEIRSGFKGCEEVTGQPLPGDFWHYSVYPLPGENLCKEQLAGCFEISLSPEESFRGSAKEEDCLVEEALKNITGGGRQPSQRAFSSSENLNRGRASYTRDAVLAASIRKRKTA